MNDDAIETFALDLAAEVDEAVRAGDASVYSEVEFTRIVLERLAEEGAVENPIVLWQEGHFGRTRYNHALLVQRKDTTFEDVLAGEVGLLLPTWSFQTVLHVELGVESARD